MYIVYMDLMNLKQTISNNLKRLRTESGLSQEAFAKKCGMHQRAYGRIENGENWQHLESLDKIADADDLTVWQLLIPDLDLKNPPMLTKDTAAQKEFYDRIKQAAEVIAKIPVK